MDRLPINKKTMRSFALAILKKLKGRGLDTDTSIYAGGSVFTTEPRGRAERHISKDGFTYYERKQDCPCEYANKNTVCIISEGPFYDEMNAGGHILEELDFMAEPYGLYGEQGHTWSLSFYEGD